MFIPRIFLTVLGVLPLTAPPNLVSGGPGLNGFKPSLIADVGYAKYLGQFTPPFAMAHLGIPYAEPPIGDLRFRKPVPLNEEKLGRKGEPIDATQYPLFCVQGSTGIGDAGGAGTEDCLKVNVYSPVNATADSKRKCLARI